MKKGASWELREGAEVPFPDSVQALIAAASTRSPKIASRCSPTPPSWQGVLGGGPWLRWVSAISPTSPIPCGSSRERSSSVPPRSSIDGEAEYAFWHILTRDVAYAQLPRASRASRHVAAGVLDRVRGSRTGRGPRRRARLPLRDGPGARRAAGQTERASELEAPALDSCPRRRTCARPGHRRGLFEPRAGPRPRPRDIANAASARPIRGGRPAGSAPDAGLCGPGGGDLVPPCTG